MHAELRERQGNGLTAKNERGRRRLSNDRVKMEADAGVAVGEVVVVAATLRWPANGAFVPRQ
jgi:hypothetical protein